MNLTSSDYSSVSRDKAIFAFTALQGNICDYRTTRPYLRLQNYKAIFAFTELQGHICVYRTTMPYLRLHNYTAIFAFTELHGHICVYTLVWYINTAYIFSKLVNTSSSKVIRTLDIVKTDYTTDRWVVSNI